MTTTPLLPTASARARLADARTDLEAACAADRAAERYAHAARAAVEAAAVLLTARTGRPVRAAQSRPNRRVLWSLLADVAPELGEWSAYFGDADRLAEQGRLGHRGLDDLVRAAGELLTLVGRLTGVPVAALADARLTPLR